MYYDYYSKRLRLNFVVWKSDRNVRPLHLKGLNPEAKYFYSRLKFCGSVDFDFIYFDWNRKNQSNY